MQRTIPIFVVSLCAYCFFGLASCAETTPSATESVRKKESAANGNQAKQILRSMTDYFANLKAFTCHVHSHIEIKTKDMDNRVDTKMVVRVEHPNRLALMIDQGMMGINVYSDGKQLIQFIPIMNRYTVKEAPADFAGFGAHPGPMDAAMMGGFPTAIFPIVGEDLYEKLIEDVIKSEYLGTEKVGDVLCHRLRFEQPASNWDVWISTGDQPLVYKIVPDLSRQFADPQSSIENLKMEWTIDDWNTSPQFTEADFTFTPPEGAEKVEALFEGFGGEMAEAGHHPLIGQPAPAFETVNLEGKPVDLQKHLGKEMILLDFWATWCGPCIRAMPDVDAVAKKYADRGLVFYAVNVGEDAETAKQFLADANLDVPVAMDPDGEISQLFQVEGIPQTVLVGKDGKVQVVHVGFSTALGKELERNIEDLLAGKDLAAEALTKSEKSAEEEPTAP